MPKRKRGILLTEYGLERLETAIAAVQDVEKFGQSFTQAEVEERAGINRKTIKKIRDRSASVDENSVKPLFTAFGLELETADFGQSEPESSQRSQTAKIDWGEKPDTGVFFGRTEEIATLSDWILADNCRLLTLLGMGGIGKTSLAAKLANHIHEQFDYVIWRSLREAPPLDEILVRLIQFLSDQQETEINLPSRLGERIIRLLHYLRQHRCLLVLDNLESILQAESTGQFRDGYEGYGELIRRIGEAEHQSCLLLTSRECPRELAPMAGDRLSVRLCSISGIDAEAGREILKAKGLEVDEADTQGQKLMRRYGGNPQALHLVATAIRREFLGDVDDFLEEEGAVVEDVWSLLDQHLARLSALERSIFFWLAINREPVGLDELMEDLLPPMTKREVRSALGGLSDRSLIETVGKQFTLQNVIMEFTTDRFVNQVSREWETLKFDLFHTHALVKATAKDYVRETQIRFTLKPIVASAKNLTQQISLSLRAIRQDSDWTEGYAASNLLHLLCQLQIDSKHFDFSQLTLRQVYLKGIQLQGAKLVQTKWIKPVITYPFGLVKSLAYSPDGRWLVTGSRDNAVRLWDLKSGECRQTLTGHTRAVNSVTFSPNGQLLATGSGDCSIRLWEVKTGECRQTLTGHAFTVISVAFSPDGQLLATGSGDSTVRLWKVETGKCHQILEGHKDWVSSVAFSPNEQLLATGSRDSTVCLWQISNGECCQTLTGHTNMVTSVIFSSNGQFLASGSGDSTIRLWKVKTGECYQMLTGHTHWVVSVALSPNGEYLASGSDDTTVRLWKVSTGECYRILTKHTKIVNSVAFSPDGQLLATGSGDSSIRLWKVKTGECYQTLTGYTNMVNSVAFSPNGHWLATGNSDATSQLLNVNTGEFYQTLTGHTNIISSVSFGRDGQLLATGSRDNTVRLWKVKTGECCHVLIAHTNIINSVSFSPDGQLLATGSGDNTVRLWEVKTGECHHTLEGHKNWIDSVAFSPDEQLLATGSGDNTVRLWEVKTGTCQQIVVGHTNVVTSVAFSPDGQLLATGSGDKTVRLWEVRTGECRQTLTEHTNFVNSVSFSPDGQLLATGSGDCTIRLWEVRTGECRQTLGSHTDIVSSVAFSPDGKCLATSSRDATIRLWKVSTYEDTVWRIRRPYEGTDITGSIGLTEAQRASMLALGAVDHSYKNHHEN